MTTRTIVTSHPDVACDLCGRGLLRGERPDVYVGGGRRRTVCELCAPRAAQEGWRRENGQGVVEHGEGGRRGRGAARGRSLLGRLGLAGGERGARPVRATRREAAAAGSEQAPLSDAGVLDEHWDDIGTHWAEQRGERPTGHRTRPAAEPASTSALAPAPAPAPAPGDVADVARDAEALGAAPEETAPTGDQLVGGPVATAEISLDAFAPDATGDRGDHRGDHDDREDQADLVRALEVFNAGEHPRRIAGVTRALGPACLKVAPLADAPRTVAVVAAWELCWYRYEVDLDDEAGGARLAAEGTELEELPSADRVPNAVADERGELALLAG